VDVLAMGPEGGWHECANADSAPIGVEQAVALVAQRTAELCSSNSSQSNSRCAPRV
jgi:hypothetical protein